MVPLALDHVNIRTSRLAVLRDFYVDALGLREGPRPPSSTRGVWLYTEGGRGAFARRPVVHLVETLLTDDVDGARAAAERVLPPVSHFAFAGRGREAFVARLTQRGVRFQADAKPDGGGGTPVLRVRLHDPDGNEMHLDFPADELPAHETRSEEAELTCGQELASAAPIPQQWADLMSHIALNLERHARWVGTDTDAAAREHDGMQAVAVSYRAMAESAWEAAKVLEGMASLLPAPHDPAKRDLAAQTEWMRKKLVLQRALGESLLAHADEAEAALAAWTSDAADAGAGERG